jgi:hypothetical protein
MLIISLEAAFAANHSISLIIAAAGLCCIYVFLSALLIAKLFFPEYLRVEANGQGTWRPYFKARQIAVPSRAFVEVTPRAVIICSSEPGVTARRVLQEYPIPITVQGGNRV